MVGHPANDGPRHPVKGVLEVKTKGCGLPIRCVGSLYTMVGKFAPARNANIELERGLVPPKESGGSGEGIPSVVQDMWLGEEPGR